ncbi:hypothetical protein PEC302110_13220 [Pectobacterium araliae]|uniref:Uncharacterized protein n=1 Tax=Pectobacterium araliae TaxID=3073862 RepID=A0AAN0MKM6_9GAMM|nr:hypothetical protein PEC302110_13220 [Pectobacterium sp. MAFF 302110]
MVASGFTAQALSADSLFKALVGSIYSLKYSQIYRGAHVLTLTLSHVPLTPPASGTTCNRNTVVADKTTALCQSDGDIVHSSGGSAEKTRKYLL